MVEGESGSNGLLAVEEAIFTLALISLHQAAFEPGYDLGNRAILVAGGIGEFLVSEGVRQYRLGRGGELVALIKRLRVREAVKVYLEEANRKKRFRVNLATLGIAGLGALSSETDFSRSQPIIKDVSQLWFGLRIAWHGARTLESGLTVIDEAVNNKIYDYISRDK